jgi:beta-mannosidase
VKDYEKWDFRFVSEFGMQSFSSPATQATFCPPRDANIFGSSMENHQKNKGGNQVVLDYISRRYRFPADQGSLIYLSQLNQVDCVQTGVAHYRRLMPRCMGALYWQLNDCWPVASWSSIEFTGRWKALHHVARRFFAPAVVSAHVPGDEVFGISNYRKSTVRLVHLYTSYDGPKPAKGVLSWDLFHLDGRKLETGNLKVTLKPMRGARQKTLNLGESLKRHGRENIYLRVALDIGGSRVSEDTALLTLPRFMDLPKSRTKAVVRIKGARKAVVEFASPVFQHRFAFDFEGHAFTCSDNFFDLQPGETKRVKVQLGAAVSAAVLRRSLRHLSLADTY